MFWSLFFFIITSDRKINPFDNTAEDIINLLVVSGVREAWCIDSYSCYHSRTPWIRFGSSIPFLQPDQISQVWLLLVSLQVMLAQVFIPVPITHFSWGSVPRPQYTKLHFSFSNNSSFYNDYTRYVSKIISMPTNIHNMVNEAIEPKCRQLLHQQWRK